MPEKIPEFLKEMLVQQYGEDIVQKIAQGYLCNRPVTLRANTIKTNIETVKNNLIKASINFKEVAWNKDALIIENANENDIRKLSMYENGEIYLQSLSSMIPPIILNPQEGENILDMAAAPGGKTTQVAALSDNKARITACEKNKIRAQRLKYNLEKQGVKCASVMLEDARTLDDFFSFDKILLDAPCSGSGTLNLNEGNIEKFFTKELILRSIKTQEELLKKALNILKPGNEMIYSTCSILKDENEYILNKVLSSKNAQIIPIDAKLLEGIPTLPVSIDGTICVEPNELYEGFFIAKIRKNNA